MNYTILEGDNRDTLKTLEDNSVDSIITDPNYVEIAKKRIEAWNNPKYDNLFTELFE